MKPLRGTSVYGRTLRLGASTAAIAMMLPMPAWAADNADATTTATADAAQNAPSSTAQSDTNPATNIVITGRRRALEAADQRKKNASSIIDSVVADEAGKLPDNSITEVLQRVQGVTIVRFAALGDPDHFSVEGSGIQVRGLSGVASRLNGREIFSSNNGRALLWGDVTPELMSAVDVYKSPTADLIEGGTGGQVDLRTKLPFDYKNDGPHLAATFEASRGDLAKKNDLSGSILLTDRWSTDIGDIGILVDVAKSRLTSESNFFRMEPYFHTKLLGQTADYFIPGGYDFGEEGFKRDRTGIYAAVQWAPNDDLKFTQTFFQSKYKNTSTSWGDFVALSPGDTNALAVNPNESTFDESGGLISSPNVFVRSQSTFLPNGASIGSGGNSFWGVSQSKTRDLSTSFTWNPGSGPLHVSGAYQHVKSTASSDGENIFRGVDFPSSFGLDLTDKLPLVTIPETGLANFADPARYYFQADMPHNNDNRGKMDTAQLDAEYQFGNGFFKAIKFGGRWSKRSERDLDNGFNWTALGANWNGDPVLTLANAAPGDVELHHFGSFFHGGIDIPDMYFPSLDLDRRSIGEGRSDLHRSPPADFCGPLDWGNPNYFCASKGPLPQTGYGGSSFRAAGFVLPNDLTTFATKTLATYAMVRFGRDYAPGTIGISGNVGARLVRVTNESHGSIVQGSNDFVRDGVTVHLDEVIQPRGGKASFTRVLPAANLTLEPNDTVKARFAYNVTMDLPTFYALRGSGSIGVDTMTNPACPTTGTCNLRPVFLNFNASTGNPFLKPTMSNNLDLSLEWYPKSGTTFHVAGFYKHITNLPIYVQTGREVTITYPDNTTETAVASATDYANADKAATVKGLEIGGRAFFDMLPGVLKGLGIEANYTFIDSKNPGDQYKDIFGRISHNIPLQGLSKHNYNVTLLYEKNPFSVRVAYSWRSKYLQATNANGTSPTYRYYSAPGVEDQNDDTPLQAGTQISLPVYGSAYGQLDLGATYHMNKHVDLSVQANNVTNSVQKTLMGGYPGGLYTRSWFQSDRRVSLGAAVRF